MATFNITSLSHCWDVVWNTLFKHLFLGRWSNRHPSPWGRKLKLAMMILFRALVFGSSENVIFSRKKLHETWNCEKLWKTQSCEKFTFPIVATPTVAVQQKSGLGLRDHMCLVHGSCLETGSLYLSILIHTLLLMKGILHHLRMHKPCRVNYISTG